MKEKKIMKDFKVPVKYVFEGFCEISALNKEEAKREVKENCGMVLGDMSITSNSVRDWEFPVHPDKKILKVKRQR